jgi:hypothetical protein
MPIRHFERAVHAKRDPHFGSHAQRAQAMREPIGASIELGIGEMRVFEFDRADRVGRSLRLRFEELVDALVDRRGRRGCSSSRREDAGVLRRRGAGARPIVAFRGLDRGLEKCPKTGGDPIDPCRGRKRSDA